MNKDRPQLDDRCIANEERAPLVSVVILSYNSAHLLPRAVQSVRAQDYPTIELIIVDNASTDGTSELLADYAHEATVICERENTGYARGMNRGYAAARGEFFIPLNTDAVLHPQFVRRAVALFNSQARLGVVAPEVVRIPPGGAWRFWESVRVYESEGGVVALGRDLHVRVLAAGRAGQISFKANGACPVIRRALIEEMRLAFGVAPFDPVFDTYGEDVDFAFKAWALRWETRYAPAVMAGHVRSYASPRELPDKRGRLRVNLIAERYLNAWRHLSLAQAVLVGATAWLSDVRLILRQLGRGDGAIVADAGAAWWRVLRAGWSLWRFRRAHRTWRQIDFAREVYCAEAVKPDGIRLSKRRLRIMTDKTGSY